MTKRVVLLTGFPTSFLASRVFIRLSADPSVDLRCVVQPKFMERAQREVEELGSDATLIEGDVASMDLGLSGKEFMALAGEVQVIHHCAAVTYPGIDRKVAQLVNVGGVREILELAEAATQLERLVHWSSALVSGTRTGRVLERELEPTSFRNAIEETRFRGERLVRESNVPLTVLRPAIIVGDSKTGEIDRLEGPYLLVLLMLSAPNDLRMPMPGRGEAPVPLVPVDYVVDAGLHIANDERSKGETFHLVDPRPISVTRVFQRIAQAAGRPLPRGFVPTNLATALLRAPGLDRLARAPRAFLEQLATDVIYDDRNTQRLLDGADITCPRFHTYVDTMTDYVRRQQAERRATTTEHVEDALADA